jgi:multidrug efflux pump subunit AcrA (membrane-fusion protein)
LYDLVIPLMLLGGAAAVVTLLGTVEPAQYPPADTTRVGRLRALPPIRVEPLLSLKSTQRQLQLEVDGAVVPFREARVAAEVAGSVIFKADECEAGSYVKAGQLLMRIDPTDYELEVQRLTRLQEQEYESIGEVDQEMVNAKRLIEVARADVQLQQKEVDRQQALPKGFASPAEIDQASRQLLAATQQLVSVENLLDLLHKRRGRLEASEQLAAIQLKAAEVDLQRTEIRAPIDGVIVNEDADLHTFVARGDLLVTIEDTSRVEVATNLRMDQLYWVLDQRADRPEEASQGYDLPETPALIEYELSGLQRSVYRWKGRLLRYDGIGLDPVSRTVPVRVVVDNPTQYVDQEGSVQAVSGATALVRGMYVRVKLLIQPRADLLVIPARALQPGNRVLEFVPDESVLQAATRDVSGADAGQGTAGQPGQASGETSSDLTAGGQGLFNPDQWAAGRVFLRRSVHPVDSLTLHDLEAAEEAQPSSGFAADERWWVCETRDSALSGDSYVVISPLQGVEDGALPVRAERAGMGGPQIQADRGDTPTAAAEQLQGEDAS